MTAALGALPSPTQGVWYLGPFPVRAYALCIMVGIVVAGWLGGRRWVERGGRPGAVLDIAFWTVVLGILGGRLYHVLTSWQGYFGPGGDPAQALLIWKGGLGIWGAVALGAVGVWLGTRRLGVPFLAMADALAPGIVIAQGIGRWGNWFNNELYGAPTTAPWGLQVHEWDPETGRAVVDTAGNAVVKGTFQPTFLYESLWDLGTAGVLIWADRRFRLGYGRVFALYLMLYTAGRTWIEALRVDPANHVLGLRLNVWTSLLVFLGGLVWFVLSARRHPGREVLESGTEAEAEGEPGALDDAEHLDEFEEAELEGAGFHDEAALSDAAEFQDDPALFDQGALAEVGDHSSLGTAADMEPSNLPPPSTPADTLDDATEIPDRPVPGPADDERADRDVEVAAQDGTLTRGGDEATAEDLIARRDEQARAETERTERVESQRLVGNSTEFERGWAEPDPAGAAASGTPELDDEGRARLRRQAAERLRPLLERGRQLSAQGGTPGGEPAADPAVAPAASAAAHVPHRAEMPELIPDPVGPQFEPDASPGVTSETAVGRGTAEDAAADDSGAGDPEPDRIAEIVDTPAAPEPDRDTAPEVPEADAEPVAEDTPDAADGAESVPADPAPPAAAPADQEAVAPAEVEPADHAPDASEPAGSVPESEASPAADTAAPDEPEQESEPERVDPEPAGSEPPESQPVESEPTEPEPEPTEPDSTEPETADESPDSAAPPAEPEAEPAVDTDPADAVPSSGDQESGVAEPDGGPEGDPGHGAAEPRA